MFHGIKKFCIVYADILLKWHLTFLYIQVDLADHADLHSEESFYSEDDIIGTSFQSLLPRNTKLSKGKKNSDRKFFFLQKKVFILFRFWHFYTFNYFVILGQDIFVTQGGREVKGVVITHDTQEVPTYLPVHTYLHTLHTALPSYAPSYLHIQLPIYSPIYLPTYQLIYLFTYLPTDLPIYLLTYNFTLTVYQQTYLRIKISVL